ncbi:unnamed protein product [Linum trigynum]|uniref:VTT domain-containing protein n=1 Tax=Linum trigynum TaxID=586398 RepID=A0AAV2D0V3_9ROSI
MEDCQVNEDNEQPRTDNQGEAEIRKQGKRNGPGNEAKKNNNGHKTQDKTQAGGNEGGNSVKLGHKIQEKGSGDQKNQLSARGGKNKQTVSVNLVNEEAKKSGNPIPLGGTPKKIIGQDSRLIRIRTKEIGGGGLVSINLAIVEGLRARSSLKPEAAGIGRGGGDLDSDDDDGVHVLGFRRWRRRLLSRVRGLSFTWGFGLRLLLFIAAIATFYTAFSSLPIEKKLKDLLVWIKEDLGPWGPLVLVLVYIPLTVLAVPASVLTLGGGYLFGLPVGFIADSIGATLGATAAFLVGRTVGRPYIISKLKNYPKFQAVTIAVERSGFKIVLLLRLVPLLPFNMLNYLLSVTPVRVGDFVLASMLGVMPITFALVYVGTTLNDLSAITHGWAEASKMRWIFMVLGLAISGVLFFLIGRIAKAALEKALSENSDLEAAATTTTLLDSSLPLIITVDPVGGG